MKQVINGMKYDTATAERIARFENTSDTSDTKYVRETLYRTPNDRYFIAGKGGAESKYSEPAVGGGLTGGSDMRTVSEDDALEWCEEKKIDAEIVADEFEIEEA